MVRCAGLALSLGLAILGAESVHAQSHYSTKQAQESYDAGIKFERQAEQRGDADYLKRAETSYRKAISSDPGFAAAYVRLGYILYAENRSAEAVVLLREALRSHPDNVELKHYLGLNLYQVGEVEEAEQLLSSVVLQRQDLAEAYFVLGKIQLDKGRHDAAQENFARYASLNPNDVQAYKALSAVYLQAGNVSGAEESLAFLLKIDPKDVIATINMGHVQFERGNIDGAVRLYERAYELDGRRHELLYTIASAYFLGGRYDEAIKRFEKVLARDREHMSALYFIAESELRLGNLDSAEEKFKALEALMPDYRYLRLKLAYIRMLRGEPGGAEEIRQIIDSTDNPDDLHFGAVLLRKHGLADESLEIHRRLVEGQSSSSKYGLFLARDYLELRNYSQAAEILMAIIDESLHNDLAWEMLSLTLLHQGVDAMMLGEFEQARQVFEQALVMDVHLIEAYCSLSQLALLEEEFDVAFSSFQAAEQVSAVDPNVIRLAAHFDIRDGEYQYAVKRLNEMIATQAPASMGGTGWYLMAVAQSSLGNWDEAAQALVEAERYGVVDSPANAVVALQKAMRALNAGELSVFEQYLARVDQFKEGLDTVDRLRFDYLSAINDIRNKRFSQARAKLESVRSEFRSLPPKVRGEIVEGGVLDINFELAYVYYETGNFAGALGLIGNNAGEDYRALETAVRRRLGQQALRNRKLDVALEHYERLNVISTALADQYNLVVVRLMAGRLANAESTLERYAKQNIPEAILNYAIYLDKSNDAVTATRYYERYVALTSARKSEEVRKMLATKQRVWGDQSSDSERQR